MGTSLSRAAEVMETDPKASREAAAVEVAALGRPFSLGMLYDCRSDTLVTDYIDLLIEGEKSECKPGWKKRVEHLTAVREQAEFMAKVEREENPLQSPSTDEELQV